MIRYTFHIPTFVHPIELVLTSHPEADFSSVWELARVSICFEDIMPSLDEESIAAGISDPDFNGIFPLMKQAVIYRLAAHLGELTDLNRLPFNLLISIRNEINVGNWLSDEADADYEMWSRADEYWLPIVAFRNKAKNWIAEIDRRIDSQPQYLSIKAGRPGFVYLLRSVSGHWKIGRTSSPQNRLKTFGIQLPFEVEFEHLIPTDNMSEAEASLHARFAAKRINGEWFTLEAEDIAWIKAIDRI